MAKASWACESLSGSAKATLPTIKEAESAVDGNFADAYARVMSQKLLEFAVLDPTSDSGFSRFDVATKTTTSHVTGLAPLLGICVQSTEAASRSPSASPTSDVSTNASGSVDKTSPRLSLLALTQDLPDAAKKVKVKLSVNSDEDLASVSCTLSLGTEPCIFDEATKTIVWEKTFSVDAYYSISVIGKDQAGNSSNSILENFVIDTTPPVATYSVLSTSSAVGDAEGKGNIIIEVSGLDIARVYYRINPSGTWNTKDTNGTTTVLLSQPYGTYSVGLSVADARGNISEVTSLTHEIKARYYEKSVGGGTILVKRNNLSADSTQSYVISPLYTLATWNDANNHCNNLSYAGKTDWTLMSSNSARAINADGIRHYISNANYTIWTSTTYQIVGSDIIKYTNNFNSTASSGESSAGSTLTRYVRCVATY